MIRLKTPSGPTPCPQWCGRAGQCATGGGVLWTSPNVTYLCERGSRPCSVGLLTLRIKYETRGITAPLFPRPQSSEGNGPDRRAFGWVPDSWGGKCAVWVSPGRRCRAFLSFLKRPVTRRSEGPQQAPGYLCTQSTAACPEPWALLGWTVPFIRWTYKYQCFSIDT